LFFCTSGLDKFFPGVLKTYIITNCPAAHRAGLTCICSNSHIAIVNRPKLEKLLSRGAILQWRQHDRSLLLYRLCKSDRPTDRRL